MLTQHSELNNKQYTAINSLIIKTRHSALQNSLLVKWLVDEKAKHWKVSIILNLVLSQIFFSLRQFLMKLLLNILNCSSFLRSQISTTVSPEMLQSHCLVLYYKHVTIIMYYYHNDLRCGLYYEHVTMVSYDCN